MPRTKRNFKILIDKEAESENPMFRYDDFTPKARTKLARLLKTKGSFQTVKAMNIVDIKKTLIDINPVIIDAGYSGGFHRSDIGRMKEQALSRAIYWLNKRVTKPEELMGVEQFIRTEERRSWCGIPWQFHHRNSQRTPSPNARVSQVIEVNPDFIENDVCATQRYESALAEINQLNEEE